MVDIVIINLDVGVSEWNNPNVYWTTERLTMNNSARLPMKDVERISGLLGIKWDVFTVDEFHRGLEIESADFTALSGRPPSDDDLLNIGKMVLVRLGKYPDYYTRLERMMVKAGAFWKNVQDQGQVAAAVKDHIIKAVKMTCDSTDDLTLRIIDIVNDTKTSTNEPGVELVDALRPIMEDAIKKGVDHHCDLKGITKGLVLGAFRSSDKIKQEAHRTISRLMAHIMNGVIKFNGDMPSAIQGSLEAVVLGAREEQLNPETALSIAATDILMTGYSISAVDGDKLRQLLPKEVLGIKVVLNDIPAPEA